MKENTRVGILTMYYGNHNYGAVLQSYALPTAINNMGYCCEQISYTGKNEEGMTFLERMESSYRRFGFAKTVSTIMDVLLSRFIKARNQNNIVEKKINDRRNAVSSFQYEKIPHSRNVYSIQNVSDCENNYDVFVCGSDQIWRIGWGYLNPAYWLTFVDGKQKKKISYAASISMREIPESEKDLVRDALKDYTAISVRESQGRHLLEEILGKEKNVDWVVDPTMLLTRKEWEKIMEPCSIKESYIFAYLLGDNADARYTIKDFAQKHNLKIVFIPYVLNQYRACDENFGDIQLSDVAPGLFLSLINNAKYVFTDSFHGTVFSGLFHKDFYVLRRSHDEKADSMNSRVYSLLDLFGCPERVIGDNETIENIEAVDSIDYCLLDKRVECARIDSENYLRKSLEI